MILLQLSLILYLTAWTTSVTVSNRQSIDLVKKDLFTDSIQAGNTTSPVWKNHEHKNGTESVFHRLGMEGSKEISDNLHIKSVIKSERINVTRKKNHARSSIPLTFDAKKRIQRNRYKIKNRVVSKKKTHSNEKSDVSAENKMTCTYYFETDSLEKARKILSEPNSIYLYYINIRDNNNIVSKLNFSKEKTDDILHWQYVLKDEKYLVQLPVDIDLITFFLLSADSEEKVLHLKLHGNLNCNATLTDLEVEQSVRRLLWNELFRNNSNYYLCNRWYEKKPFREFQYFITTIWVGYDLNCTNWDSEEPFTLQKDSLPLVTPMVCFFLSFHFVWIFIVLDINRKNYQGSGSSTMYYKKTERPYGIKRFIIKVLDGKFSNCCKSSCCRPSRRLILFLWLFILLPFGLYRTIVRYVISSNLYHEPAILRPSEPILYYFKEQLTLTCEIVLDGVYASALPFIFIFIGGRSSKKYEMGQEIVNDQSQLNRGHTTSFIETMITPCYNVCTIINSCLKTDCCCDCTFKNQNECKCSDGTCTCCCCNINYDKNACDSFFCHNCVLKAVIYLFDFIRCLIPICPFVFYYDCCNCCDKCNCFNCLDCCCCNCCVCCKECDCNYFCRGIFIAFNLLFWLFVSLAFCLRPIISTFTFLIRSFTYFFFVAMPIRDHLMRYAVIGISTTFYFSRYMQEVINMNEEILKYIFELENESNQSNSQNEEINEQVDKVQEKKFNYIYERLSFVKKRLYFLFLKTVIIFMYLFIALETLISNRKSFTGSNLPYVIESLLLVISPYAISLFLKGSQENFLTDENKSEIKSAFDSYTPSSDSQNAPASLQDDENSCCSKANSCLELCKFCDEDYVENYVTSANSYGEI